MKSIIISAANGRGEQPKIFGSMMGNKDDDFSIDDSLGNDDDLLGENLDEEDLKALDMGTEICYCFFH